MSPSHFQYPYTFKLFCCFSLILPYIFAKPAPAITFYEKSIELLLANDCKMPNEVVIPFQQNSDPKPFSYLSAPLIECQKTTDTLKEDEETYMLCKETFEVLHNITCSQFNVSLPQIKSSHLANDVCTGFMEMKDIFPKRNDSFAFGFAQSMPICKLLCKDKFQVLCNALLWSYDVQAQIEALAKRFFPDETIQHSEDEILYEESASLVESEIELTDELNSDI